MFDPSPNPPTAEEISVKFGFPVPEPFAKFLQFIHRETGEINGEYHGYFAQLTALDLFDCDSRYDTMPYELFPFGGPGMDGIRVGYLIHDEKIGPDFPIGECSPGSASGVLAIGRDTPQAFDVFFSRMLKSLEAGDHEGRDRIAKAAALLGISPSPDKGMGTPGWVYRKYAHDLTPAELSLPGDWKIAKTIDHLGVAAPGNLFCPDQVFDADQEALKATSEDDHLPLAQEAEEAGFLGTALYHLRQARWFEEGITPELAQAMPRVYRALGRPLLAEQVEREANKEE